MNDSTLNTQRMANAQRRKLLQGAAAALVASAAPVVSAAFAENSSNPALSGRLVCDIADPMKTLILRNHTNSSIVLEHLSDSALMFDGSIVDCNNAFFDQTVNIPANQEISLRFPKRHPKSIAHAVENYQRVQSRVQRLSDGTRVIPFTATVKGSVASFV